MLPNIPNALRYSTRLLDLEELKKLYKAMVLGTEGQAVDPRELMGMPGLRTAGGGNVGSKIESLSKLSPDYHGYPGHEGTPIDTKLSVLIRLLSDNPRLSNNAASGIGGLAQSGAAKLSAMARKFPATTETLSGLMDFPGTMAERLGYRPPWDKRPLY